MARRSGVGRGDKDDERTTKEARGVAGGGGVAADLPPEPWLLRLPRRRDEVDDDGCTRGLDVMVASLPPVAPLAPLAPSLPSDAGLLWRSPALGDPAVIRLIRNPAASWRSRAFTRSLFGTSLVVAPAPFVSPCERVPPACFRRCVRTLSRCCFAVVATMASKGFLRSGLAWAFSSFDAILKDRLFEALRVLRSFFLAAS